MSVLSVTRALAHTLGMLIIPFDFARETAHTNSSEWVRMSTSACVCVCVVYATNMPFPLWMHFPFYEMLLSKSSICSNGLELRSFFFRARARAPFCMHFRFLPLDSWCMRKHLLSKCYTCISIQLLIFAAALQLLHLDAHLAIEDGNRCWGCESVFAKHISRVRSVSFSVFAFISASLCVCTTVCSTSTCMTQNRTNLFKYEFLFLSKTHRVNSQAHTAAHRFVT